MVLRISLRICSSMILRLSFTTSLYAGPSPDQGHSTGVRGRWWRCIHPHARWRTIRPRMGARTLKIVVVVLVLAAGFVGRVTYEQVINPSTPALAEEGRTERASEARLRIRAS